MLAALEQQLQSVGSGKEHLIHVAVMLREVDKGTPPFAAAWNRWVHPRHLPVRRVEWGGVGGGGWGSAEQEAGKASALRLSRCVCYLGALQLQKPALLAAALMLQPPPLPTPGAAAARRR